MASVCKKDDIENLILSQNSIENVRKATPRSNWLTLLRPVCLVLCLVIVIIMLCNVNMTNLINKYFFITNTLQQRSKMAENAISERSNLKIFWEGNYVGGAFGHTLGPS